MSDCTLLSFQGQPALETWSARELERLWWHLHNSNGPFEWVMGFRDKQTGEKRYARSKKIMVGRGLSWAIDTLKGGKTDKRRLSFVPYSTNASQQSRWGGFDFDAHDGNCERARRLAFAAFQRLLNCESATILESSGSGGWHVWTISTGFKPVSHWIRLLKCIAREIGASMESGICEIFPPDTLSRGLGKGLRAPGAWNPGTNKLSEIYWENVNEIMESLSSPGVSGKSPPIGEVTAVYSGTSPIEKKASLSLLPFSELGRLIGGAEAFRVEQVATRRKKLQKLTGAAFHQVSQEVARNLARAQFSEKTVPTNADETEHISDFAGLWIGLERNWMGELCDVEREQFAMLVTDAERGAFRIVRSFARKAASEGASDFPIACDNLAARVNLTRKGAGELRKKFVRLGIVVETVPYRANVTAARFRWLLTPKPI